MQVVAKHGWTFRSANNSRIGTSPWAQGLVSVRLTEFHSPSREVWSLAFQVPTSCSGCLGLGRFNNTLATTANMSGCTWGGGMARASERCVEPG